MSAPVVAPPRFADEWLVRLVSRLPDAPMAQIERWRDEGQTFLSQALLDAGILTFDMLAALIRNAYRIESVNLDLGKVDRAVLALVPENVARRHHVVAVGSDARSVSLAMANPLDLDATKAVEAVTARQVVPLFCPPGQLHQLELEHLDPDTLVYDLVRKIDTSTLVEVLERESEDAEAAADPTGTVRTPVVQLVNAIITQAVAMGVSDIHIEHEESSSMVRYRIDGVLRNMMVLPRYVATGPVVARIKIMSGLDISVHFRPQDGRAKLRVGDNVVGLRVSTLPSQNGEKVVLRILNEQSIQVSLDGLGIHPATLSRLRELFGEEQGVILVTGPTGSGKTTTLYAGLREIAAESVNVVTVEDPVEYRLPGITQVQVNEKQGMTFAAVLRSVLRQDPDVILVGEIRDAETGAVALQAAQTGHLVLATLHTNNAVGAIVRLGDLGVESFKLAAGLLGVTAQRLVRRVCEGCAQPAPADTLPGSVLSAMERIGLTPRPRVAPGCSTCRFTGYKGRIPLIELLEATDLIREAITAEAPAEKVRVLALDTGALRTLAEDALWHLAEGQTTMDECRGHVHPDRLAELGAARVGPVPTEATTAAMGNPAPMDTTTTEPSAPVPVPVPGADRIVVAMEDTTLADLLEKAGLTVERVRDGAEALGSVARQAPAALLVGPGLTTLDAAAIIRTIRSVLGLVDLPILSVGARSADGEDVADTLVPGMDRATIVRRLRAAIARRNQWSRPDEVTVPPTPVDEASRIRDLRATGILDTDPEERFDRITRSAVERLGVPMAQISLVDHDRQWLKSGQGLDFTETPREDSFCGHGINYEDGMVVPDARLDYRFATNPMVEGDPGIRFYAGRPIRSPAGHAVGMMCIMDRVPHELTPAQAADLSALRDQVERELWPAPSDPVP